MGPIRSTSPTAACAGFPEVTILFQPIVDVDRRAVVIYEALTRGVDGRPYPELIAGMADRQLRAFHRRIAYQAMSVAVKERLLETDAALSINIQPDLAPGALDAEFVLRAARHHGIPVAKMMLELTEDHKLPLEQLRALVGRNQRAGFVTAMDDFGAGFGGLNLLVDCRPEMLKLDRMLVRGIGDCARRQKIVGAFIGLAKALGLTVIAEGVETLEECETLQALGIPMMQGFLFSEPVPWLAPWQQDWWRGDSRVPSNVLSLTGTAKRRPVWPGSLMRQA